MLQYIPIDKSIAFGRSVTHRGGEQVLKLLYAAVTTAVMVGVWLFAMWIGNDDCCAAINTSDRIQSIKAVMWLVFACFF